MNHPLNDPKVLTLEDKRKLAKQLLKGRSETNHLDVRVSDQIVPKNPISHYTDFTFDQLDQGIHSKSTTISEFHKIIKTTIEEGVYSFELPRLHAQTTEIDFQKLDGEMLHALNFSSYNYLGYGTHPEVIQAAKDALDRFGLGACSSPVLSGTFLLHKQLEEDLIQFFGLEGYGASLFSSGYGANLGTLSAYLSPKSVIILDEAVHVSLIEGAQLSGAKIHFFRHNDMDHLDQLLKEVPQSQSQILVCVESVYSAEGDFGKLKEVVKTAKKHKAEILVDEAHSILLTGPHGRGLCAELGVLQDVDLLIVTFSKGFSGLGGALIAKQEITAYVNWYAKCRMFSCALDPAVTGGIIKSLELAKSEDGDQKREKLHKNAAKMRSLLQGKVKMGNSESWIIPVIYGSEKQTIPLNDFLQRSGVDVGILQYPAVPKNEARIRIFITSEHTEEQLKQASVIILEAAKKFEFHL